MEKQGSRSRGQVGCFTILSQDHQKQGDVAKFYKIIEETIRQVIKDPQKGNEARKIAMYLSQEIATARLQEIAEYFNLGHTGSVSFITHQIRTRKQTDKCFSRKIEKIIKSIVKKPT